MLHQRFKQQLFLCGLRASARVNIYSFFHIANPGCADKKS
jgi:hypothetical protein